MIKVGGLGRQPFLIYRLKENNEPCITYQYADDNFITDKKYK